MFLTRKLNSLLSRFGFSIVKTSMLYDWQRGISIPQREIPLPAGAADYLQLDNPRLEELRRRYAAFQQKVSVPIVWTDEYVQSYDLQSFRGDNCYVWQTLDPNCAEINYCLTAYHIQTVDTLGLLKNSHEDALFGAHAYEINSRRFSRDLLDSINELHFLEKHVGLSTIEDLKILDVGAGYGRLACRAAAGLANVEKYLCTDAVPESTFLSEYYTGFRGLGDKVNVVPLDEVEQELNLHKIDLAVNIHSFSECSLEAIEWWLSLIAAARIRYLFIVPNASDHGGQKLALNSGEDFSFLVEKYGYSLQVKAPKYDDPLIQKYGVSPTFYFLYRLEM